jgi:methionyl-tRNA synthetase
MDKTFYITTPIYYVNDVPHIGHAYTTIAADVLARFYSQFLPYDVFFLTGVDEHGQKVQQAAAKAGIDPQRYCDDMVPRFRELWKRLNISNDAFIRTTDDKHKKIVQRYLQQLYDTKNEKDERLIYKAEYTGWYCTFDERFWTEKDVVEGLCPDCRRPVERLKESNYFFRMSQYQKPLLDHMKSHPGLADRPASFIRPPARFNEALSFLEIQRLEDLSISRPKSRLSWGIDLPFDPHYVTYVWFDALVNYLSALEYLAPPHSFDQFWPASIHLIGKDILTTHAVYWPTMLMALGLPLPQTIFAHGWWTVNGEKMSKSRGNVVDPYAMVDEFGADAFRYFLLREVPFGQDGDFSRSALINRINGELADGLGNLMSRTLTMIERFTQGRIPQPNQDIQTIDEAELIQFTGEKMAMAMDHVQELRFSRALESIWELILQHCDQYIDKNAPWNLAKKPEDKPRLNRVLYKLAEALEFAIPFIYPFMPQTAVEMAHQLGLNPRLQGRKLVMDKLAPGNAIHKGKPLFPRIDTTTSTQGAKPVNQDIPPSQSPGPAPAAAPAQITLEDFQKIQLKVAKVLSAERVPKSEKLIKLHVDLGTEQRQVVAGIGKKYTPEELVGRRIVIVANLKPAKLMGVESQGMVLAAGDAEVKELVCLMSDVDPGTKVK